MIAQVPPIVVPGKTAACDGGSFFYFQASILSWIASHVLFVVFITH